MVTDLGSPPMNQPRRIAPRVPYHEAVCLTRADGGGRLYTRSIDLSRTGLQVVATESLAVGTELRCTLLLPGGPRSVPGRVVRVTALPRGLGLAIAFGQLTPGAAAAIDQLIEARARDVRPAKLRVDGMDRAVRCEGRLEEGTVRLTAALPFLRLDGGVDVEIGEDGEVAAGVISKIALDPSTADGVPRLALEVALGKGGRTPAYGIPSRVADNPTPPPTRLPPAFGHPMPSVMVSRTFEHDVRLAEERPPRRRVHGTAEVARRSIGGDLVWAGAAPLYAPAPPVRDTERIELRRGGLLSRLRNYLTTFVI
jgi:hypothetical protein